MAKPFRLNGYHVLAIFVGFFLVVFIANALLAVFAVRSFPGEEEQKPYFQGLHFNDKLAARAEQAQAGWTVHLTKAEREGASAVIELAFMDADGAPIYDLDVEGVLSRPADDNFDQAVVFAPGASGGYRAVADNVAPGVWLLKATAIGPRQEKFELETKLYLK